jgi:hypothetical protein
MKRFFAEGGNMKKIVAAVALFTCIAVPSFAGNVVGHTAKTTGKDTAKVATVAAKDTAKGTARIVKFLF